MDCDWFGLVLDGFIGVYFYYCFRIGIVIEEVYVVGEGWKDKFCMVFVVFYGNNVFVYFNFFFF